MLKLFYAPNTCALASHIALEDTGANYESVRLSFADNDQRKPEYLAVNPKGRVPALVTDRGILTETPALLVFIAQTFPNARLAPLDDAFALAEVHFTLLTRTARAAIAGLTTRPRSPPCRRRCRSRWERPSLSSRRRCSRDHG